MIGCAVAAQAGTPRNEPAKKSKDAVDLTLAVYLPQTDSDTRVFVPQLGTSFAPGKALEDAAVDAGNFYFKSAALFADPGTEFNLVLAMHPKWESKDQSSILTVKYRLLTAAGTVLAEGEKKDDIKTQKLLFDNAFYSVSLGLLKDVLSDSGLLHRAAAERATAVTATAKAFNRALLVSRDKPAKSGTGFFINERGQVITAAHVVHDCPVTAVKIDGKSSDAALVAESLLLDLAVVDVGAAAAHVIPLRAGTSYSLGESVTNIGFPLDGVLAGSPNLTRGNVSSRAALAGSLGQFQFSAPVQPGSSGGPVVSDSGELLGVTVGTMGISGLIQKGILPQNVNFALDARYAAQFMDRNKIAYVSVVPNQQAGAHPAIDASLPAVVQLVCYQ